MASKAAGERSSLLTRAGSQVPMLKAGTPAEEPALPPSKWKVNCSPLAIFKSVYMMLFGEEGERPYTNVFLVLLPLALTSWQLGWAPTATFLLALFAMIPLAERLGFCTESLADLCGDTIAGLLNASMGNVPELIISIVALKENQIQVVQSSLLGSILSNLLLVLGSSFFIGGLRHTEQEFNMRLSNASGVLLTLAAMVITLPTVLVVSQQEMYPGTSGLVLSRIVSIFLLLCYCSFMLFQLYTHSHLFEDGEEGSTGTPAGGLPSHDDVEGGNGTVKAPARKSAPTMVELPAYTRRHSVAEQGAMLMTPFQALPSRAAFARARHDHENNSFATVHNGAGGGVVAAHSASAGGGGEHQSGAHLTFPGGGGGSTAVGLAEGEGAEEEGPPLNLVEALIWLAIVSGAIAVLSEALVDSIDEAAVALGIPLVFVSCILLPIAGNAAEHASALIFAWRDRLDVSIGVAVGSAMQISMFVLPLCVLVGWGMNKELSLNFGTMDITILLLTVVIVCQTISTVNKSTWLPGLMLVGAYCSVAVTYVCHKATPIVPA